MIWPQTVDRMSKPCRQLSSDPTAFTRSCQIPWNGKIYNVVWHFSLYPWENKTKYICWWPWFCILCIWQRVMSQSLVVSQTSNSTVHVKWRRNKIFKIKIGQYDEHQVHCFAAGGRKQSGSVGIFYYPGSNIFCVVGNREKFKGSSWLLTMSSIFHPCFR